MSGGYQFYGKVVWPEGLNRADPVQARVWLVASGWKVGPFRARKGRGPKGRGSVSIPAPKTGEPYDITDIACELGVTSYEVAIAIRLFVASHDFKRRQ